MWLLFDVMKNVAEVTKRSEKMGRWPPGTRNFPRRKGAGSSEMGLDPWRTQEPAVAGAEGTVLGDEISQSLGGKLYRALVDVVKIVAFTKWADMLLDSERRSDETWRSFKRALFKNELKTRTDISNDRQVVHKHMNTCWKPLVIREGELTPPWDTALHPLEVLSLEQTAKTANPLTTRKCLEICKATWPLLHCWWGCKHETIALENWWFLWN